ncbi:DNA-binding protein [Methylomonas sp. MO1]|uniref:DNA-binding protein n=1 Tax=Methylomonas sp. MO1 TaxID=3073619 RepID=UPI0028A52F06|nr:DNA-binding protein [Methylomonas sp. MO1]MDT4292391.1 DNA-binding protein [Methylomonas sp. MO1]
MIKQSTYQRAREACDTFFTETGQVPTIEAIKPIIGINSPSTISSAIKDWKQALAETIKTDQGALPGVPVALTEAINACWQQALDAARLVFNEKAKNLEAQQAALAAQETALQAEAARLKPVLQITQERYQEEIQQLKTEIDRLVSESLHLSEQSASDRSLITELEKANAVLSETIRQEQDKVQRLEIQYNNEHDWALNRIEEEKDRLRLQTQQELNRCQVESQRNQQALVILQAKFDQQVSINEKQRERISELERHHANDQLKMAEVTLQTAQLQNELNNKSERIRTLEVKQSKRHK